MTFGGGWEILNECGAFGVSARSGTNILAFNTSNTGPVLTMDFARDQATASAFVGSRIAQPWTVRGFLDGVLQRTIAVSNASSAYVDVSLSGLFDRVTVTASGVYGVL